MTPRKRLVLISASAGAGFAFALSLLFGGYVWYQSHPKPWNTTAIRAAFDSIGIEGENDTLVFYYTLENTTNSDYRIVSRLNISIMGKLEKPDSLFQDPEFLAGDYPVFIPAKQRLRFAIHFGYPYEPKTRPADPAGPPKTRPAGPPKTLPADFFDPTAEQLTAYVREGMTNLNGFVLFDNANRYQINFPKGW